jgi:benzoate/toluate 1,2-dioxygenase subunit beta
MSDAQTTAPTEALSAVKQQVINQQVVEAFLYREARFLDDKDWDGWLAQYAPNAEFWMPAWDDDDTLVENPMTDISLIYYGSKQGLEDRVFRIRTDRSSATSLPVPRTSHNISNVEILDVAGGTAKLRTSATRRSTRISARRSTRSTFQSPR